PSRRRSDERFAGSYNYPYAPRVPRVAHLRGEPALHGHGEPNSIAGARRARSLLLSNAEEVSMPATYNILLMGASYGSLLASKLLVGGHQVKLVCLPAEADLINAEGFRVRLPVKGRKEPVEIDSRKLPG